MKRILRRITRRLAIAAVWACTGVAAAQAQSTVGSLAENSCLLKRPVILSLADRIIAERKEIPGFGSANFGTTAAYLKLRYEVPDLAEGFALLDRVEAGARRPPRRIDILRQAFAISQLGVSEGLAASDRTAVEAFADLSPSIARQVLLADAGEQFFALVAAVRADRDLIQKFNTRFLGGRSVHMMVLDQDDDFLSKLAVNAEVAGEHLIAAMVLGARSNLTDYDQFLQRNPKPRIARDAGPANLYPMLATLRHQTAPYVLPDEDPEMRRFREDSFDVLRASIRMGDIAWLSILYNQTAEYSNIARAARAFLAEIETGHLDSSMRLEEAWAFLYDQLAQELGAAPLRSAMESFDLPRSIRHYAGQAQTTLDWINARRALIPFLTGTAPEAPQRPVLLSPDLDWQMWVALATVLRGDAAAMPASADLKVMVELLLAKGELPQALAVVETLPAADERLPIYSDIMVRLDRECDAYTYLWGAAMITGGSILFQFE